MNVLQSLSSGNWETFWKENTQRNLETTNIIIKGNMTRAKIYDTDFRSYRLDEEGFAM